MYVRRDPQSGELVLSQAPATWEDVYAALDEAGFPEDFLVNQAQGLAEVRDEL